MSINFGEIRVGETARKHILDCLERNWITSGKKVKLFEEQWGSLFNYKYNKAVSSGTDAVINLVSSLYRFGAKRGDEVIIPSLSFIATANAVVTAGFTPVFVDVEKSTLNINPHKIEEAITPKTRAIMVVHTMGRPCDMTVINGIAQKHELIVFEDACEAHGAIYMGDYIGTNSHGSAYSFYTAHLINCGEGGMVSTNNAIVAASVGSTRSHGREEGTLYFNHIDVGYNSKMNDLEASIGLEGIENFWDTFNTRHSNLLKIINGTKEFSDKAWFSEEPRDTVVCPHGFSITLKDGKDVTPLTNALEKANIQWKRNFGCIPTQHSAYKFMNHKLGDFPEAEYIGDHGIHIGTHQYLSDEDVTCIIKVLRDFFTEN
tara:strand:+ start:1439 stop:2560 length:1122 start_codon:yes stop_codon:yes gene_type:complete